MKIPSIREIRPPYYVIPLSIVALWASANFNGTSNTAQARVDPALMDPFFIAGVVETINLTRSPDIYSNLVTVRVTDNLTRRFNATDIDLERIQVGDEIAVHLQKCPGRSGSWGTACFSALAAR